MTEALPQRPAYLQPEEIEVGRARLDACSRPGQEGDWWREQHGFCTGSRHVAPGQFVLCVCSCHVGREDNLVFPSPILTGTEGGRFS